MDNMGLEMFKMWKSSWESYVKNLQMMQDQGDKMLDLFLDPERCRSGRDQKYASRGNEKRPAGTKSLFQSG